MLINEVWLLILGFLFNFVFLLHILQMLMVFTDRNVAMVETGE